MDSIGNWYGNPPPKSVLQAASAYLRFLSDTITDHPPDHVQGIRHAALLIDQFSEAFDTPKE